MNKSSTHDCWRCLGMPLEEVAGLAILALCTEHLRERIRELMLAPHATPPHRVMVDE